MSANDTTTIAELRAVVIRLRKALSFYADPHTGWAETEHANAYEDSRDLVPDDDEEQAERRRELREHDETID